MLSVKRWFEKVKPGNTRTGHVTPVRVDVEAEDPGLPRIMQSVPIRKVKKVRKPKTTSVNVTAALHIKEYARLRRMQLDVGARSVGDLTRAILRRALDYHEAGRGSEVV